MGSLSSEPWQCVTREAGWQPRDSQGEFVHDNQLWVLGGWFDPQLPNPRDVWKSADGVNWTCVCKEAPWLHSDIPVALSYDGRIWIFGGGSWKPDHRERNDVWCSEDGEQWTQITDAAPWQSRIWFSAVGYRDHMWVLGGWSAEHGNFGDAWYSRNGADWHAYETDLCWAPRHEQSGLVLHDRIWIAGGFADKLDSEVWSLSLPTDWPGAEIS